MLGKLVLLFSSLLLLAFVVRAQIASSLKRGFLRHYDTLFGSLIPSFSHEDLVLASLNLFYVISHLATVIDDVDLLASTSLNLDTCSTLLSGEID